MSTDELKKTPGANGFIRTLSILAAAAVVALVVIYPRAVATDGWFVLMMMGMSICWICGFGFAPENRWLRRLLSLPVGWTMLLIGAWQVFS